MEDYYNGDLHIETGVLLKYRLMGYKPIKQDWYKDMNYGGIFEER